MSKRASFHSKNDKKLKPDDKDETAVTSVSDVEDRPTTYRSHSPSVYKYGTLRRSKTSPRPPSVTELKSQSAFESNRKVIQIDPSSQVSQSKRGNIALNLVETEGSYLNQLLFLLEVYGRKLMEAIENNIIEGHVWGVVMFAVPEIIFCHEVFFYALKAKIQNFSEKETSFGDIFIEHFKKQFILISYRRYLYNYNTAKQYVDVLKNVKILRSVANEHPQKLTLADILITPVQRIPRYVLILKDLISKTPKDHKDYHLLVEAETIVSNMAKELNSQENDDFAEEDESIENEANNVIEKLMLNFNEIYDSLRIFIHHFKIDLYMVNNDQVDAKYETYLILFNDLIAFADPISYQTLFEYEKPKIYTELDLPETALNCYLILKHKTMNAEDLQTSSQTTEITDDNIFLKDLIDDFPDNSNIKNHSFNKNRILILSDNSSKKSKYIVVFNMFNRKKNYPKIVKETIHKNRIGDESSKIKVLNNYLMQLKSQNIKFTGAFEFSYNEANEFANVWVCGIDDTRTLSFIFSVSSTIDNSAIVSWCKQKSNVFAVVPGSTIILDPDDEKNDDRELDNSNEFIDINGVGKYQINPQHPDMYSSQEYVVINKKNIRCKTLYETQMTGLENCVWIGCENGVLYILPSTRNVTNADTIHKVHLGSSIKTIKYLNGSILVGLSNGELVTFKHKLHKWNLLESMRYNILSNIGSINFIERVSRNHICCATGHILNILNNQYEIVNSIKITNLESKDEISLISSRSMFIWVATNISTVIHCYESQEPFTKITTIDVRNDIAKFMANKRIGDIISIHKVKTLRVTCLMETEKYLWVGTSAGVIIVVVKLTDDKKLLITPVRTIVLSQGHVGPVRFINFVKLPKNIKNESSSDSQTYSERQIQSNFENYAFISGGEGLQDYNDLMYDAEIEIKNQGKSDHECSIILWSITN